MECRLSRERVLIKRRSSVDREYPSRVSIDTRPQMFLVHMMRISNHMVTNHMITILSSSMEDHLQSMRSNC